MRFQTDPRDPVHEDETVDGADDPLARRSADGSRDEDDDLTADAADTDVNTDPVDRDEDGEPDRDEDGEPDRDGDGVPDREDGDGPGGRAEDEVTEPAPLPTAFGASSVGAAVAASAVAGRDPDREPVDPDVADPDATERAATDLDPAGDDDRAGDDGAGEDDRAGDDGAGEDDRAVGVAAAPPASTAQPGTAPAAGEHEAVPVADAPEAVPAAGEGEDGAPAGLAPGTASPVPTPTIWADDDARALRDRWRDVQLRFVDDPRGAAEEARGLIGEALDTVAAALARQRDELDGWRGDETGDTENLRVAVRGYRQFLDRLLGL